ncbi:MAG: hypothetical protein QM765_33825 [Myxococcales bacterium]
MLRRSLPALLTLSLAACGGGTPPLTGSDAGGLAGPDAAAPAPKHYTQAAGTATWVDACATGTAISGFSDVDLTGFNFLFFGEKVTTLKVSNNGWLSFSAYLPNSLPRHDEGKATLPSESAPNGAVYALWEDLNLAATKGLCVLKTGTAGSQVMTVQWNAKFVTSGGSAHDVGDLSFEVQLAEGTNTVQILYKTVDTTGTADCDTACVEGRLAGATVGIENEANTGTGHPGTEAYTYATTPAAGASVAFTPSDTK